jgi:hypothetical protein
VNALLAAVQASPLGEAMRSAGVWSYGIVNAVHVVCIAMLFGSILVLDLRLVGWRAARPLHEVAAGTVPVAATALVLAALSGLCLIATNATEYARNPFLLIKFAALAVALANLALLHRSRAWRAAVRERRTPDPGERRRLALGGAVSIAGWLTVIVAGRLMGYW